MLVLRLRPQTDPWHAPRSPSARYGQAQRRGRSPLLTFSLCWLSSPQSTLPRDLSHSRPHSLDHHHLLFSVRLTGSAYATLDVSGCWATRYRSHASLTYRNPTMADETYDEDIFDDLYASQSRTSARLSLTAWQLRRRARKACACTRAFRTGCQGRTRARLENRASRRARRSPIRSI